uniref:Transposase n=1 Tax=Parascaris univalens TaxID=6257 RepID=A0A915BKK8_PARUN
MCRQDRIVPREATFKRFKRRISTSGTIPLHPKDELSALINVVALISVQRSYQPMPVASV